MPLLARFYLRTALIWLAAGSLLGGLLLWNKGLPFAPWLSLWFSVHISLVVWGWLWNLTLGIAFWILPRFARSVTQSASTPGAERKAGAGRGRAWLAWTAYLLVNTGVVLWGLSPWLRGPWPNALGGLAQFLAALAFAIHAWPRVKPAGA